MKRAAILLLCFCIISCGDDSPTKSQPAETTRTYLHAYDYVPNYFFVDTSYKRIYEEIMPQQNVFIPDWHAEFRIKEIEVWESTGIRDVVSGNGVAFADIEPKRLRQGESYDPNLVNTPVHSGEVERGRFVRLDSSSYKVDYYLGYISINNMDNSRIYAIAYRTEGATSAPEDDYYHGTLSTVAGVVDTLLLKLIYRPNMQPGFESIWNRKIKNFYSLDERNIDEAIAGIKIFYIGANNDTIGYLNNANDKLTNILGVDRFDNSNGQAKPDGNVDLKLPYFDAKKGLILFPSTEPFRDGLRQYFEKAGASQDAEKYVYHQVYDSTHDAAKLATDRDKFLIMFEMRE